jgi:hypothetical protein
VTPIAERPQNSKIDLWQRYVDASSAFAIEPSDARALAMLESFRVWAIDFVGDAAAVRPIVDAFRWKLRIARRRAAYERVGPPHRSPHPR